MLIKKILNKIELYYKNTVLKINHKIKQTKYLRELNYGLYGNQSELIKELRKEIKGLDEVIKGKEISENDWIDNRNNIRNNILELDPRYFLSWDVIIKTMFVLDAPYLNVEFNELLKRKNDYYLKLIKDSNFGLPYVYWKYPKTSGNSIHLTYHLLKFEEVTGCNITDLQNIFEVGGGFGKMADLFLKAGFKGSYVIYDLPEFSAIQRYYLSSLGYKGFKLINSVGQINKKENLKSLFIATWSLSEIWLDFRNKLVDQLPEFDYYLIAFQQYFHEIDNNRYFENFSKKYPNIDWQFIPIRHLSKEYPSMYLFGSRKTK